MSIPEKPINQIGKTTEITDDTLLIVEKTEGTKVIKYSDLIEVVKKTLGITVLPKFVDTLEITESGYVPQGYLVKQALDDKQAQIRAAYGYYGKPIDLTWAQIEEKRAAGDLEGFNIGDYKDITLSTGEQLRMELAGINTYKGYPSNNNDRLYFISRDCLETLYPVNDTNTNTGGFPASKLKTILNTTIFNTLPEDLRAVIKADKRLGSIKGNWGWKDDQKLWLPSELEVWGHNTWSEVGYGNGNGIQFPIFAGSLRHICKGQGKGSAERGSRVGWWCSSPYASNTTHFCSVYSTGYANNDVASTAQGVPVCFTI